MSKILDFIKTNKYAQLSLELLVGLTLGSLLGRGSSETKIKETLKQQYELKISEIEKEHSLKEEALKKSLDEEERSHKQYELETSLKLQTLSYENTQLKSSTKRSKFKLVKPDGTILEKEYDESNTESSKKVISQVRVEFSEKVKSIEDRWKKVHEEKVKELKAQFDKELEKAKRESKSTEIIKEKEVRKRSFRPEVGINTQKNAYVHATYPLFDPVVVGAGFSGRTDSFGEFHIGIGLDF